MARISVGVEMVTPMEAGVIIGLWVITFIILGLGYYAVTHDPGYWRRHKILAQMGTSGRTHCIDMDMGGGIVVMESDDDEG